MVDTNSIAKSIMFSIRLIEEGYSGTGRVVKEVFIRENKEEWGISVKTEEVFSLSSENVPSGNVDTGIIKCVLEKIPIILKDSSILFILYNFDDKMLTITMNKEFGFIKHVWVRRNNILENIR